MINDNIIGIPLSPDPPAWQSSTPTPEEQLCVLDYVYVLRSHTPEEAWKIVQNQDPGVAEWITRAAKPALVTAWLRTTPAEKMRILTDDGYFSCLTASEQTVEERLARKGSFIHDFRDYNFDKELERLVKGKRIAYVGPSSHLAGKGLGEKIDSYDLVVRINQSYHMPEKDWEDYGSRTDILMNCLNINKLAALNEQIEFARTLKYIICPMASMWDIQRVNRFLDHVGTPWHNVDDGYLFKVFREVGTTCNTGLMGIITLLNYDIEELFISGMSFFNMNTFGNVYHDTYHNDALKNDNFKEDPVGAPLVEDLRMDVHNQIPQIEYFSKILAYYYNRVITLDDYLEENFNENYSNDTRQT